MQIKSIELLLQSEIDVSKKKTVNGTGVEANAVTVVNIASFVERTKGHHASKRVDPAHATGGVFGKHRATTP